MYSFSYVLWAIFWSFLFLFFVRQPAIFLITEPKMTQKLIPKSSHDKFKAVSKNENKSWHSGSHA